MAEDQSDVVSELLRTRALVQSINARLEQLVAMTAADGPLVSSQQQAIAALSGWQALYQSAALTTNNHPCSSD